MWRKLNCLGHGIRDDLSTAIDEEDTISDEDIDALIEELENLEGIMEEKVDIRCDDSTDMDATVSGESSPHLEEHEEHGWRVNKILDLLDELIGACASNPPAKSSYISNALIFMEIQRLVTGEAELCIVWWVHST